MDILGIGMGPTQVTMILGATVCLLSTEQRARALFWRALADVADAVDRWWHGGGGSGLPV